MKKIFAIMLVMFVLGAHTVNFVYAAADENAFTSAAEELKKSGIMNGDPNGDMRLNDALTRAEATALIVRAYGYDAGALDIGDSGFSDMEEHWAYKEVALAKACGLAEGTGETIFEPEKSVTVQEFVKMIITLLGYKTRAEAQGGYPHGYLMNANALGLLDDIESESADNALRGEVAVILSNALDIPLMKQTGFGATEEFTVMDGKNGVALQTLRIIRSGEEVQEN